jgi:SET domain-containing protein
MKKARGKARVKSYPSIEIKKSYTGKGIFAKSDIHKGVNILQYIGKYLTTKEANDRPNRYIFEIDENWSIDGSAQYNTARYFNHSCKPNAESVLVGTNRIFIASKRKIKSGEEITFDYGPEYVKDYIKKGGCKCVRCSQAS